MEAAPGAKPTRREPPPVPPNYVSLRHLQELRLKEKEEQERRRREEEEAAARREAEKAAAARREAEKAAAARREAEKASAARREAEKAAAARRAAEKAAAARRAAEKAAAARREAEKAAAAAAIKREAEAEGRAVSWEASGGAKERHRGGGQGHQWVAVAHRAPATSPWPMGRRQGAARKNEAAIGGGRGEKGPDNATPDNAPSGGGKHRPAEVVPQPSHGGKPGNESESRAKGKGPRDQAAESSSSDGPGEPANAAILSSRGRFRRGRPTGAGGRSAETWAGIAPEKAAGPSPPRGAKPDDMGKPKPPAPRRADAMAGSDSPDGKKAAPAQAPSPSAADGSSKPTSSGEIRKTTEPKPEALVEGQRRRQVVEVQAVAELNPRGARCSAGPWRGRGNEATEQHGRVWVPKAAAAAGSSASAGL
ncbi:hypothetical protein C2845_PM01G31730 [Panicum miliaceum]|uniref:Uncharacterized protein n=1 Tax=Panicum miliaceum TaxID=4540 RepID=A0A3L6TKH7_PANMI|nr:hypothetical protein C2845_PM01G31730 [Panicum miliaceum]